MKMKLVAAALGAVAIISLVTFLALPPRASAMDETRTNLTRTEEQLHTTLGTAATKVQTLQQHLAAPDPTQALANDLEEFTRSTQRLTILRGTLAKDIREFDTARVDSMNEFTTEVGNISDAVTRRAMEHLRQEADEEATAHLALARETLASLDQVIAQGADLHHAGRCVMIADEMHGDGEEFASSVRQAKAQASSYAQRTNELLARVTHALGEPLARNTN